MIKRLPPKMFWFVAAPCGIVVFFFKYFYNRGLTIFSDGANYYAFTNYYLNQILRGVYPFWNPLDAMGRPGDIYARFIGDFNPFYYSVIIFNYIGMSPDLAHFIFLISYFLIGAVGFYLLVERIYADKRLSYLALLLFLFSAVGYNIFSDSVVVLLLVPSIWFYYFLVSFARSANIRNAVGLTFTVMILAATYLPFYFITIFIFFSAGYAVLDSKKFLKFLSHFSFFVRSHKLVASLCIGTLLLAFIPGLMWMLDGKEHQYALSWRQAQSLKGHTAGLDLATINRSGSTGRASFFLMFSHLNLFRGFSFFIPIFYACLIFMSPIVRINRRMILFFSISLFTYLITLTDITPILKLLYDHVFFFKLFRNLHYMLWFFYPFMILFAVEVFKGLLDLKLVSKREKLQAVIYTLAAHGALISFLFYLEDVVAISYITVCLSCLFFLGGILRPFKEKGEGTLLILLFLISFQSAFVFHWTGVNNGAKTLRYSAKNYTDHAHTSDFAYQRPLKSDEIKTMMIGIADYEENSGISAPDRFFYGMQDTYDLQVHLDVDLLQKYTQYKFVLFDSIQWVPESWTPEKWKYYFRLLPNEALVEKRSGLTLNNKEIANRPLKKPIIIKKATNNFSVVHFDLNEIKIQTSYQEAKFLVYNDSYHPQWLARINGKPVEIYKANKAFKGVWVPAGKNVVHFQFLPAWKHCLFKGIMIWYVIFFFILIYTSIRREKRDD